MADISKVIRNLNKMIEQGAPKGDIDAYLNEEGVSLDQVKRNTKMVLRNPKSLSDMPADPTSGMSKPEKLLAGSGKWFNEQARGLAQIPGEVAAAVPGDPLGARPSVMAKREDEASRRQLDQPLMDTPEGKAGYIGTGMGVDLGLAGLTRGTGAMGLFAPMVMKDAARYGLLPGAIAPATSPEDRVNNAGMYTGMSMLGQGVGMIPQRLASPVLASDTSRRLAAQGVNPTPGQSVDPTTFRGKLLRNMEERVGSIPIVGDIINNTRQEARRDLHGTSLGRAGGLPGEAGPAGVNAVDDRLGNQLDSIGSAIGKITPDAELYNSIQGIRRIPMTADQQGVLTGQLGLFDQAVKGGRQAPQWLGGSTYTGAERQGEISGQDLMKIRSQWSAKARGLKGSSIESERTLGIALEDGVDAIDNFIERAAGPDIVKQYAKVRDQYGNLVRVEGAVARAAKNKEEPGMPTPSQLMDSVVAEAQGMKRKTVAGGRAKMQDLASDGLSLADTRPNSGTPERMFTDRLVNAAMLGAAGTGAGYAGDQAGLPWWLGPSLMAGAGAATYGIPAVNKYMAGNVAGKYGSQAAWAAALANARPAATSGLLWDYSKDKK
jgi:hypothetical protein